MPVFSNNAGGGGGPTPPVGTLFNSSPGGVAVGDAVYLLPAPNPPNTVARACAGAGPLQTPDAIGVVISTPTPTTCVVVSDGLAAISPPLPPLLQGATYYVNPVPAPAPSLVPVAPSGSGEKVQEIGVAASSTQLYVYADPTSLIL